MEHWKFLIIGITGDLSRKKVLPALSEFAIKNFGSLEIELIGYSRSNLNIEELRQILGVDSSNHPFKEITLIQGQYNDPSHFLKIFENLHENEKLVAYFAVPPEIFIGLLEIFRLTNKRNIFVIIEKPFGQDINEAQIIIKKIHEYNLRDVVHFCDHYLFKESINPRNEVLKALDGFRTQKPSKVSISAIETVDVRGRAGYFDKIGTIKDMIPSHFYSMWHALKKYDLINYNIQDIIIDFVKIGQYKGYENDVERTDSNTETYFYIEGHIGEIKVNLESGKKRPTKLTEILIYYPDLSEIRWNIDPYKKLYLNGIEFDLNISGSRDHTVLFDDLKNDISQKFLGEEDVINGWKFYKKIREYIEINRLKPEIY